MLRAAERVHRYVAAGRDAFAADEGAQIWVVHHLEILGEAARGMSDAVRGEHADVPWSMIVGLRNVLIHQYFDIDIDMVWGTIERDLPPVIPTLERLADELAEATDPTPPSSAP